MYRAMMLGVVATLTMTSAATGRTTMRHATGQFVVTLTPEATAPAPAAGMPTGRMGLAKTFSGALAGEATGTMLSAGTPGEAMAYVAIDQFRGTVEGKAGGFLLLHRGTMTKAGANEGRGDLSIVIAPDSGTGALAGIEGTLSIDVRDGAHFYDLAYTLPK